MISTTTVEQTQKIVKTQQFVKMKSKGLGDTIEKITKATGIKKVVEKINPNCGCNKRKENLNKMFPYKK